MRAAIAKQAAGVYVFGVVVPVASFELAASQFVRTNLSSGFAIRDSRPTMLIGPLELVLD